MSANRDLVIHRALWATTAFNVFGALLFFFPGSAAGQLAGLPAEVPVLYRAIVALFVLLFAGAYAWLAMQARPDRPMIALAASGKAGVFLLALVLWLGAQAPLRMVLAIGGDLVFAAIFVWWLAGTQR
jgi:hypothetical protein